MSKFNVNYRDVVSQNWPHFLRFDNLLKLAFSVIKPLQTINNDGVLVGSFGQPDSSLFQFQSFIRNFLNFDARTIYLEKFLNDIYDPVTEGIFITNNNISQVLYLFNAAEERADVFFYNNWDAAKAYVVGDFAVSDNKVFQANTGNTNEEPPNAKWDFIKTITFLFNVDDDLPVDYTVNVPTAISLQPDFSIDRITSQINLLNAAGRTFAIVIIP